MPGKRGTGRQRLYPAYERGGEELQGLTVGAGELPRVEEGIGEGFTGCALPNPEWSGKGGERVRREMKKADETSPGIKKWRS